MLCPTLRFAAIVRREGKGTMTPPKPDLAQGDVRTPMPTAMLRDLQSEMEALLHLLPGAALHLPPLGPPDEEAVEAGFDNMPV